MWQGIPLPVCSLVLQRCVYLYINPQALHLSLPYRYTWFTMDSLEETWRNLQKIIKEREVELNKETERQDENDRLRKQFAQMANSFHQWLTETRYVVSKPNSHLSFGTSP